MSTSATNDQEARFQMKDVHWDTQEILICVWTQIAGSVAEYMI